MNVYLFVNTIVILLHCVYLMQSFHHILSDMCKYLIDAKLNMADGAHKDFRGP
jgi:hypothetical protein